MPNAMERLNDLPREARIAMATVAATFAIGGSAAASGDAGPISVGLGSVNEEGDYFDQTLSYYPDTGKTNCKFVKHDDDFFYGSTSLVARIETKNKPGARWKTDTSFKQPWSVSDADPENPHTSTGLLETRFRSNRIEKRVAKVATRIVCEGSENNSIALLLTKRDLGLNKK